MHALVDVELGAVLGHRCDGCSLEDAMHYVAGFVLALNVRDAAVVDSIARSAELEPAVAAAIGTMAGSWSGFTPVSRVLDKDALTYDALPINLDVWDAEGRSTAQQLYNSEELVWTARDLLPYVSSRFTLHAGDVLLLSPPTRPDLQSSLLVQAGFTLSASITDVYAMEFAVSSSPAPQTSPDVQASMVFSDSG
eukprot:PLAT15934.1.p1 GENE.PLAT15934.1~~PLAT15934.1.p1  ORF type:complete len:204 (-),score=78.95 PLAT15934.1:70-651(-)